MFQEIIKELKHHAPFTFWGAVGGGVFFFLFQNIPHETAHLLFDISHPAHVFMSAFATASMYQLHKCRKGDHHCNVFSLVVVGYVGSIGVATLSDSIIPFLGEQMLGMPHSHPHIGFIEEPWVVNPLAFLGIAFAYYIPQTKFPHLSHVLLSTWASLFHMMMAGGGDASFGVMVGVIVFLFAAVWLPCCLSDIIFPMVFTANTKKKSD